MEDDEDPDLDQVIAYYCGKNGRSMPGATCSHHGKESGSSSACNGKAFHEKEPKSNDTASQIGNPASVPNRFHCGVKFKAPCIGLNMALRGEPIKLRRYMLHEVSYRMFTEPWLRVFKFFCLPVKCGHNVECFVCLPIVLVCVTDLYVNMHKCSLNGSRII